MTWPSPDAPALGRKQRLAGGVSNLPSGSVTSRDNKHCQCSDRYSVDADGMPMPLCSNVYKAAEVPHRARLACTLYPDSRRQEIGLTTTRAQPQTRYFESLACIHLALAREAEREARLLGPCLLGRRRINRDCYSSGRATGGGAPCAAADYPACDSPCAGVSLTPILGHRLQFQSPPITHTRPLFYEPHTLVLWSAGRSLSGHTSTHTSSRLACRLVSSAPSRRGGVNVGLVACTGQAAGITRGAGAGRR